MAHQPRRRASGWFWLAALVAIALLVLVWTVQGRTDLKVTTAITEPTTSTLPQACADALAMARIMAVHIGPLAKAANDHVNIMDLLQLTIDGKPGGIDGSEAFRRSAPQMAVMESHGPDAEVQVQRFKELARKCPLR